MFQGEKKLKNNTGLTEKISMIGTYFTQDDKNEKPLPDDYYLDISGYNKVTITGNFSREIPENKLLIMRIDNMYVRLFLNGDLIYSYGEPNSKLSYSRSLGNTWDNLISPGIKSTDTVTIELSNIYTNHVNSVFKTFLSNIYCGYEHDLIIANLMDSLVNIFLSIFIICIGVLCGVYSLVLYKMKRAYLSNLIFSFLSISGGIWFIIDFNIQSYFLPYPIFNNALDIISLLLTAVFLQFYFAARTKNKFRYLLIGHGFLIMLLIIISIITQFIGLFDFYDLAKTIELIGGISVILISTVLICEWKIYKNNEIKWLISSTILICFGIVGDVIFNYFEIKVYIYWFKIGFFLFIILQFIRIVKTIRQFAMENARISILENQRDNLVKVLEYEKLITESTKGLYENIYDLDITHDCPGEENTCKYFESLGIPKGTPYSKALKYVAQKQIEEEFRQGYIDTFNPNNVIKAYENGEKSLKYDFMISSNGENYYWMRIIARIFLWSEDQSIHMLTYRQNIDEEKKREKALSDQAMKDPLTGLYNKSITERLIKEKLSDNMEDDICGFFIIDIDNFKIINDQFGHASGDYAIKEFARILKSQFKNNDIVGRIGGDEFVVFIPIPTIEWLEKKAKTVVKRLNKELEFGTNFHEISSSIGISIVYTDKNVDFETIYKNADEALYCTKKNGKNGFTIYKDK